MRALRSRWFAGEKGLEEVKGCAVAPRSLLEARTVDDEGNYQGTIIISVLEAIFVEEHGQWFRGDIASASDEYLRWWLLHGEGQRCRFGGCFHFCTTGPGSCEQSRRVGAHRLSWLRREAGAMVVDVVEMSAPEPEDKPTGKRDVQEGPEEGYCSSEEYEPEEADEGPLQRERTDFSEKLSKLRGDLTTSGKTSGPTSAKKRLARGPNEHKGASREKAAEQIAEVPEASKRADKRKGKKQRKKNKKKARKTRAPLEQVRPRMRTRFRKVRRATQVQMSRFVAKPPP